MSDSSYTKIFTGSLVLTQHLIQELVEIDINAIVKDETESARLAGFGGGIVPGFQEVYVNNDELEKAMVIVEKIKTEMED